ncbi:MAG: NAD(P)(+) transhydrogenase (Re/Si-specific) subunit beta, partial [Candidatus Krumholzibacteria bacterium]|nr:NAD(P)(+) transhydrogenase (Re/Si-specific) subunit beta [Candidatus Krumholzibacteria bacterium]
MLSIINLVYLIAAVLFVSGLKGLTHPRTAVRGNMMSALGMLLAIVVTLIDKSIISYHWIAIGFVAGGLIGLVIAIKIQMTEMPEMVALFNGFGGIASVLVAGAALHSLLGAGRPLTVQTAVATAASGLIGGVTFSGSMIAYLKLNETLRGNVHYAGQQLINAVLLLGAIAMAVWMVQGGGLIPYWIIIALALTLGMLLTVGIGGADMPVVISMLNSYSGW